MKLGDDWLRDGRRFDDAEVCLISENGCNVGYWRLECGDKQKNRMMRTECNVFFF